jgi:hypothetical protein
MKIKYSPVFSDYWALNIYFLKKQGRLVGIFAMALFGLFVVAPFLFQNQNPDASLLDRYKGFLGLLILPGIVVFIVIATYRGAKKRWSSAQELSQDKDYEIDDRGIRVKSVSQDAFADWSVFKEAEITNRFVFISTSQRQFHYFPLGSVPDMEALARILKSNIPTKRR